MKHATLQVADPPQKLFCLKYIVDQVTRYCLMCSIILSPSSKRAEQLVDQREGIILTPKNVQVFLIALVCYCCRSILLLRLPETALNLLVCYLIHDRAIKY